MGSKLNQIRVKYLFLPVHETIEVHYLLLLCLALMWSSLMDFVSIGEAGKPGEPGKDYPIYSIDILRKINPGMFGGARQGGQGSKPAPAPAPVFLRHKTLGAKKKSS